MKAWESKAVGPVAIVPDAIKLRVDLEFTPEQIRQLADYAVTHTDWMRVEPRKRWSEAEYKEAARYACQCKIREMVS